jgi:hypothetical protein
MCDYNWKFCIFYYSISHFSSSVFLSTHYYSTVTVIPFLHNYREGEVHGPACVAVERHIRRQDPPTGIEPHPVAAQEGMALASYHHVLVSK